MNIKEFNNKEKWENFLFQCSEKTFLQSWNWGEFQKKEGFCIWRFGVFQDEKIIATVLIVKVLAKRASFLFIPHGPVFLNGLSITDKKEVLELLLAHISNTAKQEKISFLRIASLLKRTKEHEDIFAEFDFRQAPIHMHPEETWELAISDTEDAILSGMRKTTRYLIRQAEKDSDIEIIKSVDKNDLKDFFSVYQQTSKRQNFIPFSESYLKNEFDVFLPDKQIAIFLGKYRGGVVCAALFIFWQNMCFYHHSGSLLKHKKIPVSYLLQWEAIKEAKNRGCTIYNLWGIAPGIESEKDAVRSGHPWAGLSLFKMGFGGSQKTYLKTQDLVLSNRYWLNYIIETARKIKRGL